MNSKKTAQNLEGFIFENQGFQAQLCTTKRSLRTAFELRYKAYKETGEEVIMDEQHKLFFDAKDFEPNSRVHLIWYEGKPVASVRSLIWSDKYNWSAIESLKYCEKEIGESLGMQNIILESGRYVVDPDFKGRKSIYAQILMFKAHAIASLLDDCQHIITMVRAKHVPFYVRMLGFTQVSDLIPVADFDLEIALLAVTRQKSMEVALSRGMPPYTDDEIARYKALLHPINA